MASSVTAVSGIHVFYKECKNGLLITHSLDSFCFVMFRLTLLHNHMSCHCRPIMLVTNGVCCID